MKTLKDFYKKDPQAYADIVAQANREHKIMKIVDGELVLVEKEPVVLGYKLLRAREYPAIKEQLDMLWHAIDNDCLNKESDFYKELKKVKEKYPKEGSDETEDGTGLSA